MKKDPRTTAVYVIGTVRTRAPREPKSLKFDLNLGAFHEMAWLGDEAEAARRGFPGAWPSLSCLGLWRLPRVLVEVASRNTLAGRFSPKGRIGLSSARPFTEVLRGEDSREDSLDPLGWVSSIVNGELATVCVSLFSQVTCSKRGKTWGLYPLVTRCAQCSLHHANHKVLSSVRSLRPYKDT